MLAVQREHQLEKTSDDCQGVEVKLLATKKKKGLECTTLSTEMEIKGSTIEHPAIKTTCQSPFLLTLHNK